MAAVAAALIVAMGASASASAATKIGAEFTAPGTEALPAGHTAMQWQEANDGYRFPTALFSPYNFAIITKWSTYASGGTYGLKLKVGTSIGADSTTPRLESALETVSGSGKKEFKTRIKIFSGEAIGVYSPDEVTGMLGPGPTVPHSVSIKEGDIKHPETPNASKGWTVVPAGIEPNLRLNLSATLEFDRDVDGFGDESQDKCVGTSGEIDGCPPPPPPKPTLPKVPKAPSKSPSKSAKQKKERIKAALDRRHGRKPDRGRSKGNKGKGGKGAAPKCKAGFKKVTVKVRVKGKVVRGKNGKPKKKTVCKKIKGKGKGKGKVKGGRK